MKFFGETFAQFKKTFYLCIAFQGKHLTREAGRSKSLPIPTAKAFGRLAQLVQSVCLTSRGSAVRIRQRPPTENQALTVVSVSAFFIHGTPFWKQCVKKLEIYGAGAKACGIVKFQAHSLESLNRKIYSINLWQTSGFSLFIGRLLYILLYTKKEDTLTVRPLFSFSSYNSGLCWAW